MDNLALVAYATALENDAKPVVSRLDHLLTLQGEELEDAINGLNEELPVLLHTMAASVYSRNILESVIATAYAVGVLDTDSPGLPVAARAAAEGSLVHAAGRTSPRAKVLRSGQAYEEVRKSGKLRGAQNTLSEAKQDINVRASAVDKVVKGKLLQQLRDELEALEGKPLEEAVASIKKLKENFENLSQNQHVQRHVEANQDLAKGYGLFSVQQTDDYLNAVPFQEFYRAENRHEWREWPDRWSEQGGRFFEGVSDYPEGRMIAETNSRIWKDLADPSVYPDATGSPYPPFAWNSGMSVRGLSLEEAKRLGLHGEHHKSTPTKLRFNASIQFSAEFDPDIQSALLDSMQDWQLQHEAEMEGVQ